MTISKKIISVLLAVSILFTLTVNGFAISKDEAEANIMAEIEAKEKEIEQYQTKIESLKNDASKQKEYIDELQNQIDAYDDELALLGKQIDELNAKIAALDGEIAEFEAKITELEASIEKINIQITEKKIEIDNTYEIFAQRLRSSYMAGKTSVVEIFLSAKDFSEFIDRTELIYQISKRDEKIVEGLRSSIADFNNMLIDLDSKKAELEQSKITLDNQRALLDESRETVKSSKAVVDQKVATIQSKIDQVNAYVGTLNKESARYKELMQKADQKLGDLNIQLDKINVSSGDGTVVTPAPGSASHGFELSTKGTICPLQGAAVEIREYSWNHAKRGYGNRATDMGSKYGSSNGRPIYAFADGKVAAAGYQSAGGNYVYIDHGNGLATRYYHCSSLAVSTGAAVKQGQIIAYVGSTGTAATGPHLHFEVYVNKTQVAPEDYLKRANGTYVSPIG